MRARFYGRSSAGSLSILRVDAFLLHPIFFCFMSSKFVLFCYFSAPKYTFLGAEV